MRTTMPIASRRTFVGLGAGVLAAALSASAKGAMPPGLAAAPAPGKALAETRYRTIDVSGLEIFYRAAGPAAAPVVPAGALGEPDAWSVADAWHGVASVEHGDALFSSAGNYVLALGR